MSVVDRVRHFFWHTLPIRPIVRADSVHWMIGMSSLSGHGPGFLIGTETKDAAVSLKIEWWRQG